MEQRRISFDELWEQEEREGLTSRLKGDYPVWLRRHKRRRTVAAAVVVAALALSPFAFHLTPLEGYDFVCCNRSGIAEGYWADVASNILTTPTI